MAPIATAGNAGAGGACGRARWARMVLPTPPASRQITTVSVRVATIDAEPAVGVGASSAPTGSGSRAVPSGALGAAKICLPKGGVPIQFVPSYVSPAGTTCGSPVDGLTSSRVPPFRFWGTPAAVTGSPTVSYPQKVPGRQ